MTGSDSQPDDLSVVPGGATFQVFRRLRLSGDDLEHVHRRVLVITLIAWPPLFFLAAFASPQGGSGLISFLRDVEVQVRFLIALPILIAAERVVHDRIRPIARRFVQRGIIFPSDLPRFYSVVSSAIRIRNSSSFELGILALVYATGPWLTLHRLEGSHPSWYQTTGSAWALTPAGFWYVFISVPIVQFFLARWYLKFFIWFRFLWQISRRKLHLVPTHPDRAAGLSFLGRTAYAFSPILFAEGVLVAGLIASEVLYQGRSLFSFKWQIGGVVAIFVSTVLLPLVMFTPQMAAAKRKGLADYGQLAQRYVDDFEKKWVMHVPATEEQLLGASDIQSLADLGNSYTMVREMNLIPFGPKEITRLVLVTLTPLTPLLLTIFSPEELFLRLLRVLF